MHHNGPYIRIQCISLHFAHVISDQQEERYNHASNNNLKYFHNPQAPDSCSHENRSLLFCISFLRHFLFPGNTFHEASNRLPTGSRHLHEAAPSSTPGIPSSLRNTDPSLPRTSSSCVLSLRYNASLFFCKSMHFHLPLLIRFPPDLQVQEVFRNASSFSPLLPFYSYFCFCIFLLYSVLLFCYQSVFSDTKLCQCYLLLSIFPMLLPEPDPAFPR